MSETRQILEKIKNGEMTIEEAESYFKSEPFKELGFAKLDHHRKVRSGFPEVVFCEGKADDYIVSIFEQLAKEDGCAFGTRATEKQFELIREKLPDIEYDPVSRIIKLEPAKKRQPDHETGDQKRQTDHVADPENQSSDQSDDPKTQSINNTNTKIGRIAVCCAGTADIPVAEEAAQTAEYFGSRVDRIYDVGVSGIHRLLSNVDTIQKANCIIAVAGMEGALPSVLGGLVENPVIAVPTSIGYGASFEGLSALLTMINSCANGIAVVNIDNGFGAGYIATQINRLAER